MVFCPCVAVGTPLAVGDFVSASGVNRCVSPCRLRVSHSGSPTQYRRGVVSTALRGSLSLHDRHILPVGVVSGLFVSECEADLRGGDNGFSMAR